VRGAVEGVLAALDAGDIRVAEKIGGEWTTHGWIQQAITLYFRLRVSQTIELGPFEYHDKVPLKHGLEAAGVRVVPPGVARYGSHLERGVVLMPGYVNVGARVGEGTMVDTWATVGSCAQIGRRVHLSGGVGIGGVLEPPQSPARDRRGRLLRRLARDPRRGHPRRRGRGDRRGCRAHRLDADRRRPRRGAVELRGRVPSRAVVIPGFRPKKFPAGSFGTPCALVIGERRASTDTKTSLNEALREHGLAG
jgi:2,3,4,5-tetrahydropyridine-2-carboxylate N-succinyltransferase